MASTPPAQSAATQPTAQQSTAQQAPSVTKRDGTTASFDTERIRAAVERAFEAAYGDPLSPEHTRRVQTLTDEVVARVSGEGEAVHVERIQNEVEATLGRAGEKAVARRYTRDRVPVQRLALVGLTRPRDL